MSNDAYELAPMCVTPDGLCEEGDGPPGADSSTPRDTQGESPQAETLSGQARHAGNAEARWRALTSHPDFCQVGDKIVGFDSCATLGNPVNYSPNVITAGQRTYRVGDLCQGTEGNAGSGVGSGTSQGSGHVLFMTGHDNVKANGLPVVRDGSESMINCNAAGAGGAKGYVHTNTESVNSQPEESSEPLSEAELFQQQGEANLERVGELRDALYDNPNGKTAAEAEALYAEVQQLVGETRAQQDALMDALREGRISGNDYIESSFEVDEAANRAADMQQEAERQVRYTSESGRNIRAAGVFMAEAATPYGTVVDIRDTIALWGEGRYLAASGMTLLTAVSVVPGVGLLRKADDVVDIARNTDRAEDAAGSANRSGTPGDNDGLQVEQNSGTVESSSGNSTAELTEYGLQSEKYIATVGSDGRRVYKNLTDIDPGAPTFVDRSVHRSIRQKINDGWTNVDLMRQGYAPIGSDGKQMNLHHILGQESGPMVELTTTTHQNFSRQLHGLIEDGRSFRNDPILNRQYNGFRREWWKTRAEDFQ